MYKQELYKILPNYVKPKILKKIIGIKNGSMDTMRIMTL